MKHISEYFFEKKNIFYFILVAIVIGGVLSYDRLSKLEDPEITVMVANVITVYPGASAHEVELQVTNVLENELSALSDINHLISRSEANVSIITVELTMTVPQEEIPQRWEFLRRKLELAAPQLPKGCQTPMVIDDVGDVFGMFYALVGDEGFSYKEMSDYAGFIEREMLEVDGVRKVAINGEQHPEIRITFSADKLSEMGILPIQIINAIGGQTSSVYAGSFYSGDQQLRVSVNDKTQSIEDLRSLLISSLNGSVIRLGDLAEVEVGYNEPMRNTFFVNNQKAIGIAMSMESGENIVKVGASVDKRLDELKQQIPEGLTLVSVFSQPEKVDASISSFMWNLIFSVLIVIVVLMFTMGFRGGVIIGSGLVLTILATFPLLLLADGTLQRISLGAFIVAMGMLVDNAIVVYDGILIERQRGKRGMEMLTKTAKQTAMPLLGATLIAIAAFSPVYLSPDTAGTYVRDLFVVLAISLSISWLLALTQVPFFASLVLKDKKGNNNKRKEKPQKTAEEQFNSSAYRVLKRVLATILHYRATTLIISTVLLVLAIILMKNVDKTFFPDFNYNQCYIEYTLPIGSTPDEVNKDLAEISKQFLSYDEVEMVVTSHGMTPARYCLVRGMMTENADNYGELIVNFKDYETMKRMKPALEHYIRSQHPEAISRLRNYSLNVKTSHSIEARITGPDPAVLKRLSREIEEMMLNNLHVDKYTVCNDWQVEAKTMVALYDPIAANATGTSRQDVSNAILMATDGLPIGTIYNGETAYPVKLCVHDSEGQLIQDLEDIPVWNMLPSLNTNLDATTVMGLLSGAVSTDELMRENITSVPLSAVTNGVTRDWEEPVVRRIDGKRMIEAQCEPIAGISPDQVQLELDALVQQMDLPVGYSMEWVGASELKADGLKGIMSYIPLAGGIILLVLLFLFNDYRRPLIVLLCLPMAIVGVVPGLVMTAQPFSFIAIVGVIGLTGMIIKNAIVLLDEIELRLYSSTSRYQAIIDATVSRMRPVGLASLTTILGMLPLLSDPMYASMAVAIIAGLIVGTLITLLFVPVLYSVFYGIKLHHSEAKDSNKTMQEIES